ncbi:MAG: cysteine hydrolase [Rhodoferax sp.]|jgi:nicotinamidase-related amidase|nr:cysteine hydrolase [Rhodoferax sp.]
MRSALLVIDVQRALCEGEQASHAAQQTVERINQAAAAARAAGAVVVYIQHETATGPFARGSDSWQLAADLARQPGDPVVHKTTPDAFQQTGLQALLDSLGVTELVICGMQTEFCVDTTTRRAAALGYPVVLLSDGHSTNDKPHMAAVDIIRHHNHTLPNITSFGPVIRACTTAGLRYAA